MVDLPWFLECSELTLYAEYLLYETCSRNESCMSLPFLGCKQGTFHTQKIDDLPVGHFSVWISGVHRGPLPEISGERYNFQVTELSSRDYRQHELFRLLSPVSNFCGVGLTPCQVFSADPDLDADYIKGKGLVVGFRGWVGIVALLVGFKEGIYCPYSMGRFDCRNRCDLVS